MVALAVIAAGCDDKPDFEPPTSVQNPPATATTPPAATPRAAVDAAVPQAGAAADLGMAAPAAAADTGPSATAHASLFVRASRCGECHEKMHLDWGQSAHSRASRSAGYRKGLAAAGPELRELCESCHLPSLAYGQHDDLPGRPSEGVSCDGCHTLSAVTVSKTQATMKFDPSSGKKYGPILGATGHYFHDMSYSVLHTKSEACAGCHHLTAVRIAGQLQNIPVVSDYSDWKLYGKGKACQDCHMPSRGTEAVAKGAKPRANVPAHVFAGAAVLGKQIRFDIAPKSKPGELAVEIQHNAGHALPSGFVDRRLIVRAEFFAQNGVKLATSDHVFGIKLVDANGQPAPFFRAARVAEDHRMIPGRLYVESFPIPATPGGAVPSGAAAPTRVTVSLLAAPTAPELSAVYGEPELTVIRFISLTLPVRPGGR